MTKLNLFKYEREEVRKKFLYKYPNCHQKICDSKSLASSLNANLNWGNSFYFLIMLLCEVTTFEPSGFVGDADASLPSDFI